MKNFIAVVAWTHENRIAKFQDYDTQGEADSHVATFGGFVAEKPGDIHNDWLIDPDDMTVSVDVVPPDPGPTNDKIYDQVMQNEKVFKAFAICINNGTIVPGANVSNAALKTAVKAEM